MEEQKIKEAEEIRLKEWEKDFDQKQKLEEQEEILKDEKIRLRELENKRKKDLQENNYNNDLTSKLENFEIKQSKEN